MDSVAWLRSSLSCMALFLCSTTGLQKPGDAGHSLEEAGMTKKSPSTSGGGALLARFAARRPQDGAWTRKAVVPGAGIEPARLAAGDFESPASTNFTTRAGF